MGPQTAKLKRAGVHFVSHFTSLNITLYICGMLFRVTSTFQTSQHGINIGIRVEMYMMAVQISLTLFISFSVKLFSLSPLSCRCNFATATCRLHYLNDELRSVRALEVFLITFSRVEVCRGFPFPWLESSGWWTQCAPTWGSRRSHPPPDLTNCR